MIFRNECVMSDLPCRLMCCPDSNYFPSLQWPDITFYSLEKQSIQTIKLRLSKNLRSSIVYSVGRGFFFSFFFWFLNAVVNQVYLTSVINY